MGGIVHHTLDNFLEVDVKVCQEVLLAIHQNLIGVGLAKSITRIYSHPQGFMQCATWLRENLPNAELLEVASTAKGVQRAKRHRNHAAIAAELASDIYGVKILARNIEDSRDNTTRFLVIGRRDAQRPGAEPKDWKDCKTSIMFSVEDKPGSLYELLKPFAGKGINLSKIESRPTKRRAWDYVFFTDVDGHIQDPRVKQAIDDLQVHCKMFRILGSYPRDLGAAAAPATGKKKRK
jgi:chorismate mutase/prephenate dehydratase